MYGEFHIGVWREFVGWQIHVPQAQAAVSALGIIKTTPPIQGPPDKAGSGCDDAQYLVFPN